MTARALLPLIALVSCARGGVAARSDAGSPPPIVDTALSCPAETTLQKRTTSEGTTVFCARAVPCATPACDVGPGVVRTGPSVELFPSGALRARGDYVDDAKSGAWVYFRANGERLAEGEYDRGHRAGRWRHWRFGGRLVTVAEYQSHRLEGNWSNVYDGKTIGEGRYDNDLASGAWASHFCGSGALHQTLTFARGALDGPCARFDERGRKMLDGAYEADQKDGAWKTYYADGTRFESAWRRGARDGAFRWFVPDGHVAMQGALARGKLDGEWSIFDAQGHTTKRGVYRDGALVSGVDVTSVPALNGYESNAYCAVNNRGFVPSPPRDEPPRDDGDDATVREMMCGKL